MNQKLKCKTCLARTVKRKHQDLRVESADVSRIAPRSKEEFK
jgi:hypothetical protein